MEQNDQETMPLMDNIDGNNPTKFEPVNLDAQKPNSETTSQSSSSKYQTEPYRWLILTVVTLA